MGLRPEMRTFLDSANRPPFPELAFTDPQVSADYLLALRQPRPNPSSAPVALVDEHVIDGGIPVRIYHPEGERLRPTVVFFHGGGWVLGDLDSQDSVCRELANAGDCVVVSVHYRRAPEDRYPAALDDGHAAILWAYAHIAELGGAAERLVVAGSSAGGNLAAACALKSRDLGTPPIALQVMICAVFDSRMDTASHRDNAAGYLLEHSQMAWFWDQYVPDVARRSEPLASPAHAKSLAGLPSALIVTAEFDPLRDEGEAYAARLAGDGVPTELVRYDGQIHGFIGMSALTADASQAIALIGKRIRAI